MFNLPKETYVNRFIAKNKFYNNVAISSKVKEDFIRKVEKITWLYKLSPNTLNIDNTDNVEEIEIIEIIIKEKNVPVGVINTIIKSIPYKILFLVRYQNDYCYAAKAEELFITEWNKEYKFDFKGYTLESVYQNIIKVLINKEEIHENFDSIIQKKKDEDELLKKISILETKVKNEKQFDRQVQYNMELNELRNRLKQYRED